MGRTLPGVSIRRATATDASAVADVYLDSFGATYDFPLAHPEDEVRAWIRQHVVPELETWVADAGGPVVGFVALSGVAVEQLYVRPDHTRHGIGSLLLRQAQARRPRGLELWTFQVNRGARRFYAGHGFTEVEWTSGADNEEGQPDVRLVWRPEP